jgi:uncharacterized membrane protein
MSRREVSPERLQFFSDGVFAVLITILVLELHAPAQGRWSGLVELWPEAASYAVSYLFIAIVWVNHHHLLSYAEQATPRLIWANFAHLFTVSLLPFTTSWVARTHMDGIPVCAYAAVFALVNASYIVLCNELVDRPAILSPGARRLMHMRSLLTLTAFVAAGLLALWHPLPGFGLICACLLTYLRPEAGGSTDNDAAAAAD